VEKLTGGSSDVPDLVEDVFVRLFEHPGHFKKVRQITWFLFRAARSVSLNYLERRRLIISRSEEIGRHYRSMRELSPEALETIASCRSLVYREVEKLPRQCRQVFLLYFTEDLSNRQIAERLGLSEKTVANHKTNALKILKTGMLNLSRHLLSLLYCVL
jgi:RNA polymerase sigma-70 factor (ECF subfamily)